MSSNFLNGHGHSKSHERDGLLWEIDDGLQCVKQRIGSQERNARVHDTSSQQTSEMSRHRG